MYALVENNQFIKIVNSNKGITIGDNQYPKSIYSLWSNAEREAIGIYEVTIDSTNKKDEAYYINTDVTYAYSSNAVTGSYGVATAKPLDDVLWQDGDLNMPSDVSAGDVKLEGLKTIYKRTVNNQANGLLSQYDWYVIRNTEDSTATIPSDVSTYRTAVRTKANQMCTQIDGASDVDALKTLYTYTEQDDGTSTRPLAEFPEAL